MSITREQVGEYFSRPLSDNEVRYLIERYVEAEPPTGGIAEARIRETGTTVAAVIIDLEAENGNVEKAAADYDVTPEQVLAAVFFYWKHQDILDAEITVRNSWFTD